MSGPRTEPAVAAAKGGETANNLSDAGGYLSWDWGKQNAFLRPPLLQSS